MQVVRVAPAGLDDLGQYRADPVGAGRARGEVGGGPDRAGAGDAGHREGAGPAGRGPGPDLGERGEPARGADHDVGGGVRSVPDAEEGEGGGAGEGCRVAGERVRGGLGGVQDRGQGPLAVVRRAGLEEVDPGQQALPGPAGAGAGGEGGAGDAGGGGELVAGGEAELATGHRYGFLERDHGPGMPVRAAVYLSRPG